MLSNPWFYMWLVVSLLVVADIYLGVKKANQMIIAANKECKCYKGEELVHLNDTQEMLMLRIIALEVENSKKTDVMSDFNFNDLCNKFKPKEIDVPKDVKKIMNKIVKNLKEYAKIAKKGTKTWIT